MHDVQQVLAALAAKSINLSVDGGTLRYRSPCGALTEEDKQKLRELKENLILYLKAKNAAALPAIKPTNLPPTPSYAQIAWWNWVHKSSAPLSFENIGFVQSFHGCDFAGIQKVLRSIMDRHSTLRSAFSFEDGKLAVSLNLTEQFRLEMEDGPAASGWADETQARRSAESFTRTPLRTDDQWLVRARVFPLQTGDGFLALVFHHLVIDGYSMDLLKSELADMLNQAASGIPKASGQHGGLSFLDYARTETDWYRGEPGHALIAYWQRWLSENAGVQLRLNGKLLEWGHGCNVNNRFKLPSPIREKVLSVAKRHSVIEFIVYASVFALALARWSGQEQVLIRCLGNLRDTHAPRHIIGNLVCADPISIRVEDDVGTLLQRVLMEYSNATQLRLPSLQNFPPNDLLPAAQALRFTNSIAATINFLPQKAFEPGEKDEIIAIDTWRPAIHRSEPEEWPAMLWPIHLRLSGQGSGVSGIFQFNHALIPSDEQKRLMDIFFEALIDMIRK